MIGFVKDFNTETHQKLAFYGLQDLEQPSAQKERKLQQDL